MQHQKSEKKKVVVTLCRVFPVTHSLAGKPTEFEGKLKEHKKIHTIRYNKNGVWDKRYKDIASGKKYLSVREWTGRPYNSEQREFAQYDKIGLQHITMTYGVDDAVPQIWIDGKQIPIEIVAKNDGLTVEQFVEGSLVNQKVTCLRALCYTSLHLGTDMGKDDIKHCSECKYYWCEPKSMQMYCYKLAKRITARKKFCKHYELNK